MTKKTKTIKNMVANYVAASFSVAAPLIMLPLYLNCLGMSQWGLISLAFLAQSLMSIVDSGLSQALTREFAARSNSLSSLKKIYTTGTISNVVVVSVISIVAIGLIETNKFLFPSSDVVKYDAWIYGVFIFGASSIASVSKSLLVAMEKQVLVSGINVFFTLFRHLFAFLLVLEYKNVESFFLANIVSQFIESTTRFVIAHKTLKPARYVFEYAIFKETKDFMLGILIAVIIGALAFNLERFIVSIMVPLEQFAIYSIAATLGTGVIQLTYPITQAFFPSLIRNNRVETKQTVLRLIASAAAILVFCWTIYCIYGDDLLESYLKNTETTVIFPLLTVYLAGSSINLFWNIAQLIVMKEGNHKLIVKTSIANLVVIGFCTPVILGKYGINFVPYVFLLTNIIGLIAAAIFTTSALKREKDIQFT